MPAGGTSGAGAFKIAEAFIELSTRDVSFSKGVAVAGAALTGLVGWFASAATSAANFEKQMAYVNTMLLGRDTAYLPKYSKQILALGVQFGDTSKSLSKSLYDILSAAIPADQALKVLNVAAESGAAGMTTTAVAADALITMINAYGVSAQRAGDISDWMFEVVRRGVITYPELASQLGTAAAASAMASVSMEELGASISTVTRAGIPAARAMTAINGMMQSFLAPTAQARAVAKQFNLELSVGTIQREGLIGIMHKLEKASTEELRAIFRNIRGFRAMSAIMMNMKGFTKDLGLIQNRTGRTQEAFAKISGTLAFQLSRLREALHRVSVEFGSLMLPTLKKVTASLMQLVNVIHKLSPAFKATTVWFIKIVPAALAVAIILPRIVVGMKMLIGLLMLPIKSPLTAALLAVGAALSHMAVSRAGGMDAVVGQITRTINHLKAYGRDLKRHLYLPMVELYIDVRKLWRRFMGVVSTAMGGMKSSFSIGHRAVTAFGAGVKIVLANVIEKFAALANGIDYGITHAANYVKLGLNQIQQSLYVLSVTIGNWSYEIGARIIKSFQEIGVSIKTFFTHTMGENLELGMKIVETGFAKLYLKIQKMMGKLNDQQYSDAVAALETNAANEGAEILKKYQTNLDSLRNRMKEVWKAPEGGFGGMNAEQQSIFNQLFSEELRIKQEIARVEKERDEQRAKELRDELKLLAARKQLVAVSQVLSVFYNAAKSVVGAFAGEIRQGVDELGKRKPFSRPVEGNDEDRKRRVPLIGQGVRADVWAFSGMKGVRVGRTPEERTADATEKHKEQAARSASDAMKKWEELKVAYDQSTKWLKDLVTSKPSLGNP